MANQAFTALTFTALSTSVNGDDLDNLSSSSGNMIVDITAITGTSPTLTVTLQGKDPASGKYYDIIASAALTATGTTMIKIMPGGQIAANTSANNGIPKVFRVIAAAGGTTPSITGTVGINLF